MNNDLIRRGLAISYATSGLVRIIDGEDWIKVSEVKQSLKDVPKVEPEPISGIQEKALKVVENLTKEHAININEEGFLRRAILFDGKSAKGEWVCLDGEGLKKSRRGKYVIYDVDFLLDNLAREVNIMESARQWKAGKGNDND